MLVGRRPGMNDDPVCIVNSSEPFCTRPTMSSTISTHPNRPHQWVGTTAEFHYHARMSADHSPDNMHVLIVDNDDAHAEVVSESLETAGYRCTIATSGAEGVRKIEGDEFDIVVTDLVMNDVDGFGILAKAKEVLPDAEVIVITGHGTVQSAVKAMQERAFNYLTKPLDLAELRTVVGKAAENVRLRRTNLELNRRLDEKFGFEGIIGSSPKMLQVLELMKRVAAVDVRVLISGETGTGKELVAEAIHQNSPRKKKPFLALNCASFVENILDVELFGSLPGIYTDARDRQGKFEYCNGGTLFLDEIGDMPLATQSKLLRVLEINEVTRLGANEPIKVNVRVISATNKNLKDQIAEGKFREDLFQRLRVVEIKLPSLRERTGDIPLLIEHFLRAHNKRLGKSVKNVNTAARRKLMNHAWTGNVRELANTLEHMVVVDSDGILDVDDLPPELADQVEASAESAPAGVLGLVGKTLDEVEAMLIGETLNFSGGNREEAAKILGIGERTLYRKIDKYKLDG